MKELILVRHAKSDWGNEGLKDIDRPLNERGYDDAYRLSNWFYEHHEVPQLLVSSDAIRALSTAMIFARNFDIPTDNIKINPAVYEANMETLKKVIGDLDDKADSAMLFGHNPGITNLVNDINETLFFDNIPTCGLIAIQFDCEKWDDILKKKGKIKIQQFPKEFK